MDRKKGHIDKIALHGDYGFIKTEAAPGADPIRFFHYTAMRPRPHRPFDEIDRCRLIGAEVSFEEGSVRRAGQHYRAVNVEVVDEV